jgi:putative tryptophan/tyrosine transport system substrate-binding protein
MKLDVIVTGGSITTRAAKEATTTIPIVMTQDPDPIGNGFVASLARPGGNVTGLSNLGPELSGKRLELLKEVVPRITRVAVFGSSTFVGNAQILRETELAANALKVQLQYVDVPDQKDIETCVSGCTPGGCSRSPCPGRWRLYFTATTACSPRGREPSPGNILRDRICRRWGPDDLWGESY